MPRRSWRNRQLAERQAERTKCPNCGRRESDPIREGSRDAEWLQCDNKVCKQWWHAECAAVDEEEWKEKDEAMDDDPWLCPYCCECSPHESTDEL